MGMNLEFETFDKQFIELISEFQSLASSESRLRELIRVECTRAEAAEAGKAAAERAAADARAGAAAASAAAAHAAQALATAQEETVTIKMKLDLMERQHDVLEEKNVKLVNRVAELDKELQQLRPVQSANCSLRRQYVELLDRIDSATEDARSEATHLGNELRRVEKCAGAGAEVRSRARLAAAAHARERRLAAAELQHATKELHAANLEISRLTSLVSELQFCLSKLNDANSKARETVDGKEPEYESLVEVRAALQAERAGAARLERALAAALADNAALAAAVHCSDTASSPTRQRPATPLPDSNPSTNIGPIDIFLEDC